MKTIRYLIVGFCFTTGTISAGDSTRPGLQAWYRGDRDAAIEIWQRRAQQGDAQAGLFLGYLYRNGVGLARNERLAAQWYRMAAAQGLAEAQYELGLMYELGIGMAQDPEEAARWYGLSAAQACPAELSAGGRLGDR